MRAYLTEITCIPWYKSRENAAQNEGMFGVLEFLSSDRDGIRRKDSQMIADKKCTTSNFYRERFYSLYVQGIKYREYEGERIEVLPADILEEIEQRHIMFTSVSDLLKDQGITIKSFNDVRSLVDDENGCCYYDRAEMTISVCTTKEVSLAQDFDDAINGVCFRVCGGETICPDLENCNYAHYL